MRCVYEIVDTRTGARQIGATENFWRRIRQHDYDLRRGRHHNYALSAECRGIDGQRWIARIVERVPRDRSLWARERDWIARVPAQLSFNRMAREDARRYPNLPRRRRN